MEVTVRIMIGTATAVTAIALIVGASPRPGARRVANAADEMRGDPGQHYVLGARVSLVTDNALTLPMLLGRPPTKGVVSALGIGEVVYGWSGTTLLEGMKF